MLRSVFPYFALFFLTVSWEVAGQPSFKMDRKLNEIHARDPYILADSVEQSYYLYVQKGNNPERAYDDVGVEAYRSKDLTTWEGPYSVLDIPPGFWADDKVWAPEVHRWAGKYYMLVTLTSSDTVVLRKNGLSLVQRATQIFSSPSPRGPFAAVNDRPLLGVKNMTLDGTLFIDEAGQPWMIYCQEWVQIGDGSVMAVRLSKDLSSLTDEPRVLFHGSDGPWVKDLSSTGSRYSGFVTGGPFPFRTKTGKLLLIWSSMGEGNYEIGQAISETGKITGPWKQLKKPLFAEDGGHGMIFRTFTGEYLLAFHSPNTEGKERISLMYLTDRGDHLEIKGEFNP